MKRPLIVLVALLVFANAVTLLYLRTHSGASWRRVKTETIAFTFKEAGETAPYPLLPDAPVRNIILCLGDGMGFSQIAVARAATCGAHGRLHLERLPVTGLLVTHTLDDLVTHSDASATALATGSKTRNMMISVTPDGGRLKTILEAARELGKATGLVTTTMIVDATPAAFAAHVTNRYDHPLIAGQLLAGQVDVLLGSGREYFIPKAAAGSARQDELDLIAKAQADGYELVNSREELAEIQGPRVLGLFPSEELSADQPKPSLAEMTTSALELLNRNERGFFLMLEHEGIDETSHRNQTGPMVEALRQFDEAVKLAVEFAFQDRQTLVVVTGDHETGGLFIEGGHASKPDMQVAWPTTLHTGQPVPLFACGPHAARFTGQKDNTEIPRLFAELWGAELILEAKRGSGFGNSAEHDLTPPSDTLTSAKGRGMR